MNYRFTFPNGDPAQLNDAQHTSLVRIAQRHDFTENVEVHPMFGCKGIMVNTGTMWIGVEEDGYAHT